MSAHTANIFAHRLKLARKEKNLSQERLGILAGVEESSASARMNQYERGKHVPDYLMLTRIAQALDLPPAYFYTEDDVLAEIIKYCHHMTEPQKAELLIYLKGGLN